MSAGLLASLLSIVAVVAGASTGLVAYFRGRRAASGRVGTSEAAILWQQAQEMRQMLLTEKTRAEEQRDRLIDSYTQQILPVLSAINTLVQNLDAAAADNMAVVQNTNSLVRGLIATIESCTSIMQGISATLQERGGTHEAHLGVDPQLRQQSPAPGTPDRSRD